MDQSASGEDSSLPVTSTDDEGGAMSSGTDSSTIDGVDAATEAGPIEASADVVIPLRDATPDGAACLLAIPSSCPNCMTQNASDAPTCQLYLQCFIANGCDPSTACGSNTGVCGVNTIGGGEAPYSAALATYSCACP
jgi:hypothetical protein